MSFAQVEQVIDEVIAKIADNPASSEDLERVKTQLIAEAIYAQDNQATMARWYGGALTTGLSIEDIRSWPDRIRAVPGGRRRLFTSPPLQHAHRSPSHNILAPRARGRRKHACSMRWTSFPRVSSCSMPRTAISSGTVATRKSMPRARASRFSSPTSSVTCART